MSWETKRADVIMAGIIILAIIVMSYVRLSGKPIEIYDKFDALTRAVFVGVLCYYACSKPVVFVAAFVAFCDEAWNVKDEMFEQWQTMSAEEALFGVILSIILFLNLFQIIRIYRCHKRFSKWLV